MSPRSIRRPLLVVVAITLVLGATACMRLATGSRPSPLAGQWMEVTRTTLGDTLLWSLSAEGSALLDLDASSGPRMGAPQAGAVLVGPVPRAKAYHGVWYVRADGPRATAPELCFMRPGREAETCSRYALDTISVASEPVVQLRLTAPSGDPTRTARTLVRRRR